MKYIFILAFFVVLTQSCTKTPPTRADIVGNWKNIEKSSELIFFLDGRFIGKSMPAEIMFISSDYKNQYFNGSGKWSLIESPTGWEVNLDFENVLDKKYLIHIPIFIAGESELLENKSSWKLFFWMDEEGGQRYEFLKQSKK